MPENKTTVSELPKITQINILSFLDTRSLQNLSCASKQWLKLVDESKQLKIQNMKLIKNRRQNQKHNAVTKEEIELDTIENNFLELIKAIDNNEKQKRLIEFVNEIDTSLALPIKDILRLTTHNVVCKNIISEEIEHTICDKLLELQKIMSNAKLHYEIKLIYHRALNHCVAECQNKNFPIENKLETLIELDAIIYEDLKRDNPKLIMQTMNKPSFFASIIHSKWTPVISSISSLISAAATLDGYRGLKASIRNNESVKEIYLSFLLTGACISTFSSILILLSCYSANKNKHDREKVEEKYNDLLDEIDEKKSYRR